ncbi:uncharacterized protein LOC113315854 [Papaver somniferum]|uniref:uncharacterized protein LOC113315854 n=1 Tax=Papaver somniferum TaxID=3469 RepID=UPI000E705196|nr:uncharacterized protein LOC113315854 [Papaver somniferum]
MNDHSMFILHSATYILVLLLYVDDIILTGNSEWLLNKLINSLKYAFPMKKLGNLSYFLSIEAIRHSDSLVLSQKKYTLELLGKSIMLDCKPCKTLMEKTFKASIDDGILLADPLEYKTIVGGLQYLTHTRPDICF